MPKEKSYRPKAGNDDLRLDFPGRTGYVQITKWPYETEDAVEQAYLDEVAAVTDRPEPKPEKIKAKPGDGPMPPLSKANKAQLQQRAEFLGIDASGMTKAEIVEELKADDARAPEGDLEEKENS